MASPCPLLGDGVTDDTLLHIARFLPNVNDLLRLQLTCPRFAAKVIAAPSVIELDSYGSQLLPSYEQRGARGVRGSALPDTRVSICNTTLPRQEEKERAACPSDSAYL